MNNDKLTMDFQEALVNLFKAVDNEISVFSKSQVPIKKPFIIEIEGTDRSGKETQSKAIKTRLEDLGYSVKIIHFPRYESRSTDPVKKYLAGEYGALNTVNEYQSSLLYAQDRLDFKLSEYDNYAETYDILIFDRYVGSNLIHQSVKANDWNEFTDYQYYFEYFKLNLPRPHITFFLDMPVELGKKIAKNRCNKITGGKKQDIHESDDWYMNRCYEMGHKIADKYNWSVIKCYSKSGPFKKVKSVNNITNEIMDRIEFPITMYKEYLSKQGE